MGFLQMPLKFAGQRSLKDAPPRGMLARYENPSVKGSCAHGGRFPKDGVHVALGSRGPSIPRPAPPRPAPPAGARSSPAFPGGAARARRPRSRRPG
ncbi:unnamed protein product, partial [Rangifer tarandus platyrhynchus]